MYLFSGCGGSLLLHGGLLQLQGVGATLPAVHGLQVQGLQQLQLSGSAAPRNVESSWTRDGTGVPCIARQILNHQTTREAQFLVLFFLPYFSWTSLWLINTAYYSHFLYQSLTCLKTGSLFTYVAPIAVSKVPQIYSSSHTILYLLFTISGIHITIR